MSATMHPEIETIWRRECADAIYETFGPEEAGDYFWANPRGMAEDVVSVAYGMRCDHCPDEEPEVKDSLTALWDGAFPNEQSFKASWEHETAVRFCLECLAGILNEVLDEVDEPNK